MIHGDFIVRCEVPAKIANVRGICVFIAARKCVWSCGELCGLSIQKTRIAGSGGDVGIHGREGGGGDCDRQEPSEGVVGIAGN